MRYNGKIKEIKHIIISDPSYDKDVTCRYEKDNLKEKNWIVDIDIEEVEDRIDDFTFRGLEFFILLSKGKLLAELKDKGTIKYSSNIKIEETEIGMDTACVAFGINEKADEIIESKDLWQSEISLSTLTDGLFGTVKEGNIHNRPVFIWVSGYISEDAGYSIEDIVDYLQYQFNIKDLKKSIERTVDSKNEPTVDRMKRLELEFKELTEKDESLYDFFNKDKRFSNISFAGTYLARMDLRNEQRKAGNLEGKLEKSPYNKTQEKMIDEYISLQQKYQKEIDEMENNLDI